MIEDIYVYSVHPGEHVQLEAIVTYRQLKLALADGLVERDYERAIYRLTAAGQAHLDNPANVGE